MSALLEKYGFLFFLVGSFGALRALFVIIVFLEQQ